MFRVANSGGQGAPPRGLARTPLAQPPGPPSRAWILLGQAVFLPKLQSHEVLVGKDLGGAPIQPSCPVKKTVLGSEAAQSVEHLT